jgi:hypothetical protein
MKAAVAVESVAVAVVGRSLLFFPISIELTNS